MFRRLETCDTTDKNVCGTFELDRKKSLQFTKGFAVMEAHYPDYASSLDCQVAQVRYVHCTYFVQLQLFT